MPYNHQCQNMFSIVLFLQAGVYSAILYFMMGIVVLSGGQLADVVRQRGILSTTNVRKLFTCAGKFISQV